jgi:hypothetical protein
VSPAPTPDTYTPQSAFGAILIDALTPWMTEHLAWVVDAIGTMADPLAAIVYDQGTDGEPGYVPGYGTIFDPATCPTDDLPYLGQFVGVPVPVGAPDATARALVRAESGQNRGTLASISSAVERSISTVWAPNTAYLAGVLVQNGNPPVTYIVNTGFTSGSTFDATNLGVVDITNYYDVMERTSAALNDRNAAYHLTIVVDPDQLTPPGDSAALLKAVSLNKPAGILLEVYLSDFPLLAEYTRLLSAVTVDLDLALIADVT